MDETVVSYPNDMVVLEFTPIDLGNNSIVLRPEGVHLGKINAAGVFITEDRSKTLTLLDDEASLSNNTVYAFPITIDELKKEFQDDNLDNLLTSYYTKVNQNMIVGLKENGKVSLFSKSYGEIAPGIGGVLFKKREETILQPVVLQARPNTATPETRLKQDLAHIDNLDLERYLKERIFNNDENIEDIVTTIVNNYAATDAEDVEAILALGPTGSGKTRTFELISQYLGVPLTIYDCNSLTSAGYVGKDIDDILLAAYHNSGKSLDVAQKSIVVLDEIDKLASRGLDVKDSSVQFALLKLLDGYKYSVAPQRNAKPIEMDSSFMTFVGLGAFPDVYNAKKKKSGKMSIGFGTAAKDEQYDEQHVIITEDDIVKDGGLLAELVGRFSNQIVFPKLTKEDIRNIILHSKDSYFLRKIDRFQRMYNTQVVYDEDFIEALVEGAFAKNVGGRSIKKMVAYTFKKADRAVLSLDREKPKVLQLTKDTVTDNTRFSL